MPDAELTPFDRWAMHHADLFGLSDAELKTIAGWESTLDASADELNAATAAIARDLSGTLGKTESRFVGKMSAHLEALTTAIKRLRSVRYEKGEDKPDKREWGTCAACQSTGWVLVPHPDCIRDGEWVPLSKGRNPAGVYYTLTVTCHCGLGRWVADHRTGDDKRSWTLESYLRFNPGWREQMKRRRLSEISYAEAMGLLKPDSAWDARCRRLIENVFKEANERSRHANESF